MENKKLSEMTLEELWQMFPIILTEHKSYWTDWYNEEVTLLKSILPHDTEYYHIGSTAVKDIWAKPIVDILIVVNSESQLKDTADILQKNGYIVMSASANRISLNKGYTENGFAEKVFHFHIRLKGDTDEIFFRDYLNSHPTVAKEYEKLKLELWKTYEHDRDAYTNAKTEFVKKYTELGQHQKTRPNFQDIKSYDEFIKYYWYLEELKAICKSLHLEYIGGKIELNNIIKAYFDGVIIPHKPKPKIKRTTETLTLDTSLISCGFTFGPRFRDFFIQATGENNFKFTADMVATAKAVKASNDTAFTLGDLLDIKLGKKTYAKYDNSSCQWNKFLKEFCADEDNGIFPDKLKAATRFWELLRSSDLPKVYTREFIENNINKI